MNNQVYTTFLDTIPNPVHRKKMKEVLRWVEDTFDNLVLEYKWNQPMFTDHGTFIIAFSASAKHFGVGTEGPEIDAFSDAIKAAGYRHGKMIFRIKWTDDINYDLLEDIIRFNMNEKRDTTSFWR